MEHILTMVFLATQGDKVTFSVNGVKPDLKDEDVKKLMATIIAKDIFVSTKGSLVAVSSAQITQREIKKLNIK
ncbi:DUF2922 domain-containing protein [Clostridium uliginosum]|uniref:DUF2922 domain-containing protein n=1 Tax=Clostridium uliginosum TaxID=119641 RepID=A0A1I1NZA4_9CLOT|nr:DUF2922 domain-containing protein [Clostridium uliginosum]SFC99030.1 Protein of unknown function [Clostridium uliginosum]